MRFLHPGRRTVATGLVALVASGAAAGVITVAGASSRQAEDSAATSQLSAANASAAGASHRGSRAARPALLRLLIRETAKQTGAGRKTVMQDLRSGQTLDQVAGGKASAVAAAALAQVRARLDGAVAAHRITSAQEQKRLSAAQAAIAQLMGENLAARLPGRSHTA
ncbi:MAG: hypothetical protein JOZ46_12020 [Candidatus Dormibacteraeota bacterium]|nr:hypothetical protein [Candidatus Dormibacteraeota bacterium]MBV9526527.1 hypothetical protein [Candidatus Dormibacteraeota bacterium]